MKRTLVDKLYDADVQLCTDAADEIMRLTVQLQERAKLEVELWKCTSDIKHLNKFIKNIARENEASLLEVARLVEVSGRSE